MRSVRKGGVAFEALNRTDDSLDVTFGKEASPITADMRTQARVENVCGHLSLERTLADEEDDGVYHARMNPKIFGETLRMAVVLVKRVLETVLLPIEGLSPLSLLLGPEYPPLDVLGFDHEEPEWRNEKMVDLRRPVGRRHYDVVESAIDRGVEGKPHPERRHLLAEPSTEYAHFILAQRPAS